MWVLALVGVWWVLAALKPRRRTALALQARRAVWIRPRDLAHLLAVTDAVTDRLAALASAPRVKVTARTRGGSA